MAEKLRSSSDDYIHSYADNLFKIVIFACLLISLAVVITGIVGYNSTSNALISKAKSEDMVFILKSMSERIEGRIQRAKETSFILARDPINIAWLNGMEQDAKLGESVLQKLSDIALSYDYSSTFIANVKTNHYYFMEHKPANKNTHHLYTLSDKKQADDWFFEVIKSGESISLNVNYDRGMNDTFLFVNTIMGNPIEPIGVTGVGLSLQDIAKEFQQNKVGKSSSIWMIDEKGEIQLSDRLENRGKHFNELIPTEVADGIFKGLKAAKSNYEVSQYLNSQGEIIDFAYYKLSSSDWILFYQIPRTESISVIHSLKVNTIITIAMVLVFFVIVFFLISRKIANPYKQTMMLNIELEKKVDKRTLELKEINKRVMDSIDYAKRMQESLLPSEEILRKVFKDYFVLWRPKDVVGGDFYWVQELDDTVIVVVGDCTGHGVPGALMTMTVNAILYHIVTNISSKDPEIIIRELDRLLKQAMNKNSKLQAIDDGLDLAICCIKNASELFYAGAKIDLHIKRKKDLKVIMGYNKGVGYNNSLLKADFSSEVIQVEEGDLFILTSDGYIHQNGGSKDYPFGSKRFYSLIQNLGELSLEEMKTEFEKGIKEYMKDEPQRDDIVLLGFKVK